jgi:uncharacterized membrane protein
MDQYLRGLAERLLHTGFNELEEREKRILRRVARRVAVSQDVNIEFREHLTFGQRLADRVAAFGGSWSFIIVFSVILGGWIVLNTVGLAARDIIDPYPFIFLNLVLSMLAAIQAPVIMMSQNRQVAKDRLAAANDYEVNLKAELEIMNLHEKIDDIRLRQMEDLFARQNESLEELRRLIVTLLPEAGRAV